MLGPREEWSLDLMLLLGWALFPPMFTGGAGHPAVPARVWPAGVQAQPADSARFLLVGGVVCCILSTLVKTHTWY